MSDQPGNNDLPSLEEELENFQQIARSLKAEPGDLPVLNGLDVYGRSEPLKGIVSGDHIIYVDFNQRHDLDRRIYEAENQGRPKVAEKLRRNKHRAGILVADVAGHRITDALVAAMLHQAFLLGVLYELEAHGEVTTGIFENIKNRFYRSSALNKYVTMIYGEISDTGRFRYISAAHPPPVVYSGKYRKIVEIGADRTVSSTPIGLFESANDVDERRSPGPAMYRDSYKVNEIALLGAGDILLLYTDGLSEHDGGRFFKERLEGVLTEVREGTAREICDHIWAGLLAAGPPDDDVTLVVVKKL